MHDCLPLFESDLKYKVKSMDVTAVGVDKEVMEQLSIFTVNILFNIVMILICPRSECALKLLFPLTAGCPPSPQPWPRGRPWPT